MRQRVRIAPSPIENRVFVATLLFMAWTTFRLFVVATMPIFSTGHVLYAFALTTLAQIPSARTPRSRWILMAMTVALAFCAGVWL